MKIILFLTILLSISTIETSMPDPASALELSAFPSLEPPKIQTAFDNLYEKAFYCAAGTAFGTAFFASRLAWGLCLISPWASTLGNECLLLSQICGVAAQHAFTQMFKQHASTKVPLSESSWHLNKALLSQVPTSSEEEKKLLLFLEKRWLAKATGFFSSVIKWVCPCFGVSVQVHPETTSSYARSPSVGFSQTYKKRMEAWKQSLPHPLYYPLILTRPFDVLEYLPFTLRVAEKEIETTAEKVALKLQTSEKVLVDLTALFPQEPQKWVAAWNDYQVAFTKACKKRCLNLSRILCIQQLRQEEIGGIRLLPFATSSPEEVELHDRFLVDWISNFGISANRIELDRWPLPTIAVASQPSSSIKLLSKEEFVFCLNSFELKSSHVQKKLMIDATLRLLKGLMSSLKDDQWNQCPTRSSVAQISFSRIQEQLKLLTEEKENALFFDTASKIEQIHANLSSLLEILSPFARGDFSPIYQNLLTSIPARLKPFTSYGVHSSGMTSLAGIIKAVEKTIGKTPRVLLGENTYFECIFGAQKASHAVSIAEASEEDWREVDLILAQFNPVLKRIDLPPTEYKVEKIAETLHKALDGKDRKTLTLALDCTLDFINSPRVAELLTEFQEEIEKGALNIVCYRSGLKFDLLGMDNYCGAPFYMLHSPETKWGAFNSLLTDPVLQADRLSCQWFCLAYRYAAPQLELYRQQIFDNTRALLDKLPPRLFTPVNYRIVPVQPEANAAFLDIKVSGPLHQMRSSALVGGSLYMCCMEKGHPVFYRPSLGFYHPNFTMIFGEESSTIRLTLGLDPSQIDVLAGCFEAIDDLNGAPWQPLLDKLQANLSPQISF
ncbi:MAG: hypothetical protein JSS10_02685 [Verrucomicrobia bacterium]|nr:hypothetical protein [Verrucomicrobiota bacterium]